MTHVCTIVTSNVFSLDYFDKGSLVERIHRFPFEISVVFDGCFELFFDVPTEQRQCPRLGFIRFMMALEPFTVVNARAFCEDLLVVLWVDVRQVRWHLIDRIQTRRSCGDSLLHFTEFRVNCKDYVAILVEIFQDASKFKTFA